jgi:nitrile hydratase accessory protein
MTILNPPEPEPALPPELGAPVFAQPWEAQAFALAVELSNQGVFTWTEWTAALGAEIAAAGGRGEGEDAGSYYRCWLAALEGLLTDRGLTDRKTLQERQEAWAEAYRRTPHGRPVDLAAGAAAPRS